MCSKLLPIAAAALLLTGCNTIDARTGSADRQFGEAVAWNKAVQTINPDPVYTAEATPAGSDGAKAAAASQRYRTDKVKQVEAIGTSSGGAASGSGPQ
ncbi:hypothetical protein [Sphingomonas glaciei]|uniref:Pilus assembly protein CpaD n=1 Tax=Sphingomonas glaciei TaxID=2938948 RepID=A0ABY5MV04_9SPHN|nr:hypothetical protein [Sphingomonas glaciei]UUR08315.1 hypothetical protein M1K48_01320 [Sphingomonas glaciei]